METIQSKTNRLRFGGFMLDITRRGLYRGEQRVRLTVKPLEALIFLVENCGRTVEKQELLDAVWKGTFVTEDVLVHAIRDIRRALGDDKDNPRFVQTVPRQGYRFLCEITTAEGPVVLSHTEQAVSAPPATVAKSKRRVSRWFWMAAPVVLISIWLWFFRTSDQTLPPLSKPERLQQITSGEFTCSKPSFSPDGKFIIYVSSSEATKGSSDLFIRPVGEGNPLIITNKMNPGGDLPVFTGDGNHVVFSVPRKDERDDRHHDLWRIPYLGGPPERYVEDASGAGFSPDMKWAAYTKHHSPADALWISPVKNLELHSEVSREAYTPRWSPDGEWLAYTTSNPNEGVGSLWICKVSQASDGQAIISERKQITREQEQMYGLTWAADSHSIIFASKRNGPAQLYQVSIPDGSIQFLQGGVGDYSAPSASPDGSTLIFQHFRLSNDLMMTTLAAPGEAKHLTYEEFHRWPRISPSGEKLASVIEEIGETRHLYLIDLRTKARSRLSDRAALHPDWLNKENIAFLSPSLASRDTEVLTVNIATRETRFLTQFPGDATWLAIHPDGQRLAVVLKSSDGTESILLRDLSRQLDTTIHQGSEYEYLRWLPDGTALSWSRPGVSRNAANISGGIWMIELGQAEPRLVLTDGFCPVWNEDGSTVTFSGKQGQFGLWRYDRHQPKAPQTVCRWQNRGFTYDLVGNSLVFLQHKTNIQVYSISLR
jgi:Tol biopolymer transport system component/DNA-binding winged helix-turn-helix (wHTH) protein